jgi:hypothetical protein
LVRPECKATRRASPFDRRPCGRCPRGHRLPPLSVGGTKSRQRSVSVGYSICDYRGGIGNAVTFVGSIPKCGRQPRSFWFCGVSHYVQSPWCRWFDTQPVRGREGPEGCRREGGKTDGSDVVVLTSHAHAGRNRSDVVTPLLELLDHPSDWAGRVDVAQMAPVCTVKRSRTKRAPLTEAAGQHDMTHVLGRASCCHGQM